MTEILWTAATFISAFLIVLLAGYELIDILEHRHDE